MKTQLPDAIRTREEAERFLSNLHENNESYHPEDDAHDVVWQTCVPTDEERTKLNALMDEVWAVARGTDFDPCGFILALS